MNGAILAYPIILSFIAGLVCLFIPKRIKALREVVSLIATLGCLIISFQLFAKRPIGWQFNNAMVLLLDNLSGFILIATCLFGFLIVLYSVGFMAEKNRLKEYYTYILWTVSATCAALVSNNLILLLAFWGIGGLLLYLLIGLGGPQASSAAKKTFIIVGGSDAVMIAGIAIIWILSGTFQIDKVSIGVNSSLAITAFLCVFVAAIAKAGAMPFHTWIPDSSEVAPLPVMAFLPASLDKLLGIYLLARLSFDMFSLQPGSALSVILMIVGAVTIIAAVMMALVQHNLKKLLSYHAVSQVGYMVLGIATAVPVGIAGGIFHMLNNAIYKCCLFLAGGNVEHRMRTSELSQLGGLAKALPLTFITFLIASFSISGIPPFNGFASKWMVYQGVISVFSNGGPRFTAFLCLMAAMFGSALTLASFMKLIHAIFLGTPSSEVDTKRIKEVGPLMILPVIVLALLCVGFGVFAFAIPLRLFINPSIEGEVVYQGFWNPSLATGLILAGVVLGFVIYFIGTLKTSRSDSAYIGGEVLPQEARVSGVEFYNTVKDLNILARVYSLANRKMFDIYEQAKRWVFYFSDGLKAVHTGILPTYITWLLAGFAIILFLLAKQ